MPHKATSKSKQPKQRRGTSKQQRAFDFRASELLARYTPVVRQIAGGFQRKLPRSVLREDLIAAGMSGLWDAIRRHSGQEDERFEWYVRVRIRGAILDELRAQDWLPRRARAAAEAEGGFAPAVVRFDDVSIWEQTRALIAADTAASDLAVEAKLQGETLARAVEQLPDRERHIVSAHYFQGVRFKDLGAQLGVSEPRISQLHSRAMQRLRTLVHDAA
jgi:RNA polymerase sigma factor for flagellar operon FliA